MKEVFRPVIIGRTIDNVLAVEWTDYTDVPTEEQLENDIVMYKEKYKELVFKTLEIEMKQIFIIISKMEIEVIEE